MALTAGTDLTLVGGSSPLSRQFELHLMRMADGVMEMRELKQIELPQGKTVHLEPGGLHVMLIGLKQQIQPGTQVPMTLIVKDASGKARKLSVVAKARRSSTD